MANSQAYWTALYSFYSGYSSNESLPDECTRASQLARYPEDSRAPDPAEPGSHAWSTALYPFDPGIQGDIRFNPPSPRTIQDEPDPELVAKLSIFGGSPPYTYIVLSPNNYEVQNDDELWRILAVSAGPMEVVIQCTDDNGRQRVDSVIVEGILELKGPTFNPTNPVLVANISTPQFASTVSSTGGYGVITYSVMTHTDLFTVLSDDQVWSTGILPAMLYSVEVAATDEDGRRVTDFLPVDAADVLGPVTFIPTNPDIDGDSPTNQYTADVFCTGGTLPYTFEVIGNTDFNIQNSNELWRVAQVVPNDYVVEVRCTDSESRVNNGFVTVTASPLLSAVTFNPPAPITEANFAPPIFVTQMSISGGTPPYSYSVVSPPSFDVRSVDEIWRNTSIPEGPYTVNVLATDAQGRQQPGSVDVTAQLGLNVLVFNPPAPVVDSDDATPEYVTTVSCSGGVLPYVFTVQSPAEYQIQNSNEVWRIALVSPGSADVVVRCTDSESRERDGTVSVTAAPALGAVTFVPATPITDSGDPAATYVAQVACTGGTPPYVFTVDSPAEFNIQNTDQLFRIAEVQSGDIPVTVRCTDALAQESTGVATVRAAPALGELQFNPVAPEVDANSVTPQYATTTTAVGGRPPYSFLVTTPASFHIQNITDVWRNTTLAADPYTVTVQCTDSDGRVKTGDVVVTAVSELSVGLRIGALNVNANYNFTNFYWELFSAGAYTGADEFYIRGIKVLNQPAFDDQTLLSSLPKTDASVVWIPTAWSLDTGYNTPNLSAIAQEVTAQAGWASGNAIAFILEPKIGYREIYTSTATSAFLPKPYASGVQT